MELTRTETDTIAAGRTHPAPIVRRFADRAAATLKRADYVAMIVAARTAA